MLSTHRIVPGEAPPGPEAVVVATFRALPGGWLTLIRSERFPSGAPPSIEDVVMGYLAAARPRRDPATPTETTATADA